MIALESGRQILKKKEMYREYGRICKDFDFDIDPDTVVSRLSIAKQQMVEIMKAVSWNADLVIMDEPTTSLTNNEKEGLFRRKVPVEEIGWDTPYYKTYNKHPWFIKGKGPDEIQPCSWGEGLAEADAAAEAEASGSDPS